jgi:hypothetical protein
MRLKSQHKKSQVTKGGQSTAAGLMPPLVEVEKEVKQLLLAFFLVCGNASAAEWVLAAELGSTRFYIDALSVEQEGRHRRAWIMSDFPERRKVLTHPEAYYRSTKQLQYFDCKKKASAVTQAHFYAANMGKGALLEQYATDLASASFSRHLPDTLKKKILEVICSVPL